MPMGMLRKFRRFSRGWTVRPASNAGGTLPSGSRAQAVSESVPMHVGLLRQSVQRPSRAYTAQQRPDKITRRNSKRFVKETRRHTRDDVGMKSGDGDGEAEPDGRRGLLFLTEDESTTPQLLSISTEVDEPPLFSFGDSTCPILLLSSGEGWDRQASLERPSPSLA